MNNGKATEYIKQRHF